MCQCVPTVRKGGLWGGRSGGGGGNGGCYNRHTHKKQNKILYVELKIDMRVPINIRWPCVQTTAMKAQAMSSNVQLAR